MRGLLTGLVTGIVVISLSPRVAAEIFPRTLEIANPNPVGSGARALGFGNAFIAIADDATAASWNPGGLSQLVRPEFSFALEGVHHSADTHADFNSSDSFSETDVNYASVVFPLSFKRHMVVSLNYLKLFRLDQDLSSPFVFTDTTSFPPFPATVTGNYVAEQSGTLSVLAPAFGIDLTPKLSLGITCNIWNDSITRDSSFKKSELTTASYDIPFAGLTGDFDPTLDANYYTVDHGYSLVLGALYRPSKELTFGAVAKPAYDLNLDHRRRVTETTASGPVTTLATDTEAELAFPWTIGSGVAWRPTKLWTVAADVTWTQWSEYRYDEGGQSQNPLSPGETQDPNDTYTARLGVEHLLVRNDVVYPIRCGIGYDPAPAVGETDDLYTVSVGLGVQLRRRLNVDFAYQYRWGDDVNHAALSAFDANANGSQDVSAHRFMASMIYYF